MIALVILMFGVAAFATLCVTVTLLAPSTAVAHRPRAAHPAKQKPLRGQRMVYAAANDNAERRPRRRAF